MFAMSESPKFRQITKIQISHRKKERSVGIAKHSIIFFWEHGEEVPLCGKKSSSVAAQQLAAAQQQLSSSTAEAAAAAVVAVAASKAA